MQPCEASPRANRVGAEPSLPFIPAKAGIQSHLLGDCKCGSPLSRGRTDNARIAAGLAAAFLLARDQLEQQPRGAKRVSVVATLLAKPGTTTRRPAFRPR